MRNFLLFLTSLFIGIGLFLWIGKTVGWQEIKNTLLVFSGWQGMVMLLLTLSIMIIGNLKWKEILRGEEIEVSFWQLFKPYLAGFSVMFLAPILLWIGEVFRSFILKETNQIPWTKATASVIIDRVLEWTTNLVIIFLGILFFLFKIGLPPMNLRLIFGGTLFLFTASILLFYFKTLKRESLIKTLIGVFNHRLDSKPLETEKEIFDFFKLKKKSLQRAFYLSFARVTIMYLRVWLLIKFLGQKPRVLPVLSVLGFSYLAAMVPIPTALGSHEAIQIFAFGGLGWGVSVATAFTTIIRGTELILALIGIIISFRSAIFLFKNNLVNKLGK